MRTVRDLRELINVSRLSFKESDDDEKYVINYDFSSSSLNSKELKSDRKKNPISKYSDPILSVTSPSKSFSSKKKLESNSSKEFLMDRNSILSVSYSLNNKNLLPPLKSSNNDVEEENDKNSEDIVITNGFKKSDNFDEMLTYIDASVVSEWLNRANKLLCKLHNWHKSSSSQNFTKYESFILFANFWIGSNVNTKFDHRNRRQLLEMEYSILCDEISQAFQIGIDSNQITISDIHSLLHAVLKEYPLQFLSFRGVYLILDYIETFSSNRNEEYKKILSEVKCRTLNKQYAQWLLSIRSFALINLCWGIIKFYRNIDGIKNQNIENDNFKNSNSIDEMNRLISSASSSSNNFSSSRSSSSDSSNKKIAQKFNLNTEEFVSVPNSIKFQLYIDNVFKHDLPDVLHYLILSNKCDPHKKDEQNRNLIFIAVMNNKPKILNYLIKRWPLIDINESCISGNTPLHAAVNLGNLNLVEILLKANENQTENEKLRLEIDKTNEKCMNSTALHLAVWNNFNEITIRLLQSKANPNLKMNKITNAFELALENSNEVLYELIKEYNLIN